MKYLIIFLLLMSVVCAGNITVTQPVSIDISGESYELITFLFFFIVGIILLLLPFCVNMDPEGIVLSMGISMADLTVLLYLVVMHFHNLPIRNYIAILIGIILFSIYPALSKANEKRKRDLERSDYEAY